MMVLSSLVYLILGCVLEQVASGISLDVILVPVWIRNHLSSLNQSVLPGDFTGIERLQSQQEQSIHAYKVSKTYATVQALKEVTFQAQKGEVLCLLGHNGVTPC